MNGTCCTRQELEEVLLLQFSILQAEQKHLKVWSQAG